ncbi:MAG: hypothetical protein HQK58_16020 [Deltaproteobacteria bacterium]|nr:hypothetical protein [Deltaproteobacteria bacterium]
MSKLKILRETNFGQSVAEEETESLREYFVMTNQWNKVYKGEVDIVYGPKGSGKSAIYLLIDKYRSDFSQNNIVLSFAENPRGATAFSDLKIDPPLSERAFINLWKLYLLVLIGDHFNVCGTQTRNGAEVLETLKSSKLLPEERRLKVILAKVKGYIKKYFNPTSLEPNATFDYETGMPGIGIKVSFNEPTGQHVLEGIKSVDTLLHKADQELVDSGLRIWFLIDRLDVAFSESSELEENALRALFKTYIDLNGYNSIKLKVFLRDDIWSRIIKAGFREATHITKHTNIEWDRPSLLNLIIRRFLKNQAIIQFYEVSREDVLESLDRQEELFYKIFPRQVDSGRNPDTLEPLAKLFERFFLNLVHTQNMPY